MRVLYRKSSIFLKTSFLFLNLLLLTIITVESSLPYESQINKSEISLKDQNEALSRIIPQDISAQYLNTNISRLIFEIYLDILPNGEDAQVTAHYTYQNVGNNSIFNIINILDITTALTESRLSSITISDADGELYYEWIINEYLHILNITIREPLEFQEVYSYTVTYLLEEAILQSFEVAEAFVFHWTLTQDEDMEQFTLIITLPAQYDLYNQSALEPDADYKSVDGKRFEWNYYNIEENDIQIWIVRFQVQQISTIPIPPPSKGAWFAMIGTFFVGLIAGGLAVFFIIKARTDIERKEIVETLLSQPEKEIIRIIKNENGVTTQSKICSVSGFSKAKVSYYLNELENKGIIQKERWGRMNRIRITDDSVDKAYVKESE
ncbi:MAG: winged helix-turn-helix transcriptional regulator [Candidatus Heimdallarchaeota archaeon]|nr:winged helix-turn-helix transcriptional regulator [Candidatus Heimdallarchaeota archaeon]